MISHGIVHMKMFDLEDLPNELFLIIFSYLTKLQLLQSFLQLNRRFHHLLSKYIHHLTISSILTQEQFNDYAIKYLPYVHHYIHSLTFDNYQIGKRFLEKTKFIQLEYLTRIKLIDNGIHLQEDLIERFQPQILQLVITTISEEKKGSQLFSTSLQRLQIEIETGENAKQYFFNQLVSLPISILVDLRITFSKLSEYFQLLNCHLPISIEKLYISIFSIDQTGYPMFPSCPHLNDFQLEICSIPFNILHYLLPSNRNLKRFAFIGQITTTINAQSWKALLDQYQSIEQFDLHLFEHNQVDFSEVEEWKSQFPRYSIEYHSFDKSFRIYSSKFDRLDRLYLNECVENFNHIPYSTKISHLIIRSQYWCSYIDLSFTIQHALLTRFDRIQRLSTTYRQLTYFLQTNFFHQIKQLDLEFSEQYCHIENEIADKFLRLKSLHLSCIYDGIHSLSLHTRIKHILLNQFSTIHSIYFDAIQIIDDEHIEYSISQWYVSSSNRRPSVNYQQGNYLFIWF